MLSDDDICAADPKTMQWIEMEAFVDVREIALVFFEKPDYFEPIKGAKVYSLLCEAMA